jgi:hypothetical protein
MLCLSFGKSGTPSTPQARLAPGFPPLNLRLPTLCWAEEEGEQGEGEEEVVEGEGEGEGEEGKEEEGEEEEGEEEEGEEEEGEEEEENEKLRRFPALQLRLQMLWWAPPLDLRRFPPYHPSLAPSLAFRSCPRAALASPYSLPAARRPMSAPAVPAQKSLPFSACCHEIVVPSAEPPMHCAHAVGAWTPHQETREANGRWRASSAPAGV